MAYYPKPQEVYRDPEIYTYSRDAERKALLTVAIIVLIVLLYQASEKIEETVEENG